MPFIELRLCKMRMPLLPLLTLALASATPVQAEQPATGSAASNTKVALIPRLTLRPQGEVAGPEIYCYTPGTTVTVSIKALQVPAGSRTVQWIAHNFAGQTLAQGRQELDASGNGNVQYKTVNPGIVYLSATLLDANNATLAQSQTSFAVLRPDATDTTRREVAPGGSAQPFLYGIASHLSGLSARDCEREIALMATLGFRACRFDLSWVGVQPTRDEWQWSVYDNAFALFEKYGIAPAPILGYSARWASTGDQQATDVRKWRYAPPVTEDYVTFAREAARRYGRTTRYWEVWNEPDIASWTGTPEQYATLFEAASAAIHAVKPDSLVMNGGFSETKRRPDFIPTWQKVVRTKPDIYAYHSHGPLANMTRASDDASNNRKTTGWTMPMWLNESGFSTPANQTEREQAITLIKKMSCTPLLGFDAYFWYDLRNDGTDPKDSEQNFGLTNADFTPKAAAIAAHTLMGVLRGQHFVRRIPLPDSPGVYALLYAKANDKGGTLVLWNETTGTVPTYWRAAKTTQISMMGEETPLSNANGLAVLAASPEPVFLNFNGKADDLKSLGSVLQAPDSLSVAAGQSAPLHLSVKNPLTTPLRGSLKLTASGSWHVENTEVPFAVAPGQTKQWDLKVSAPAAVAGSESLTIRLDSPQLPSAAPAQLRLKGAFVVPRTNKEITLGDTNSWGTPVARLTAANRVSLFDAAPLEELRFREEDDLSAEIFLRRVPQGLMLAVRVNDDVFAQNEAAGEEWRGDSLQWALALPSGEHYEWFAALTKNGPVATLGLAPRGVKTGRIQLPLWIHREGNQSVYQTIIPETLPGGTHLPDQMSLSLLVNDNDGTARKGWIEWTPGIGRSKDPREFQAIVVAPPPR